MTRKGPTKRVESSFGDGRLKMARAFLKAAQDEAALATEGDVGNPIISQTVNAAIGYVDALTTKFGATINRQDHVAAVKNLRAALGNRLPVAQANRLRRILEEKDTAQYGARVKGIAEAKRLLGQLEEFAAWAETELRRPK